MGRINRVGHLAWSGSGDPSRHLDRRQSHHRATAVCGGRAVDRDALFRGRPDGLPVGIDRQRLQTSVGSPLAEDLGDRHDPQQLAALQIDGPNRWRIFLADQQTPRGCRIPAAASPLGDSLEQSRRADREIFVVVSCGEFDDFQVLNRLRHPGGREPDLEQQQPIAVVHHRGIAILAEPGDAAEPGDRQGGRILSERIGQGEAACHR